MTFYFELLSILSMIPFWVTCNFEWHSIFKWHSILRDTTFWVTFLLSEIPFWISFHFEWHSIWSDIPFWVTFHFEWHPILGDILFWVIFHFEWYSILSDIWVIFNFCIFFCTTYKVTGHIYTFMYNVYIYFFNLGRRRRIWP